MSVGLGLRALQQRLGRSGDESQSSPVILLTFLNDADPSPVCRHPFQDPLSVFQAVCWLLP